MKKLLKYLIGNLVDHPQSVKIERRVDEENQFITYEITAHTDDLGQIIGRQGKIIKAIRRLTSVLALEKGEKANVQLIEDHQSGRKMSSLSITGSGSSKTPSPSPSTSRQ